MKRKLIMSAKSLVTYKTDFENTEKHQGCKPNKSIGKKINKVNSIVGKMNLDTTGYFGHMRHCNFDHWTPMVAVQLVQFQAG